jgi:hypothetical protein
LALKEKRRATSLLEYEVTNYKNFAGPEGRCFKISHNSLKHDASRDKNG